ncbi:hypothetical protein, partial [Planomicrobium sp. CPCC 101079]|uniref:hypothetical protein n=1 Tax=Planomicrobium sp. CPCC 101079 TaxID=2599618 RepID=UPI001C97A740
EPVSWFGFDDPRVRTTSLHFYKKRVAQTMAMVCATHVSMFPRARLQPLHLRLLQVLIGLCRRTIFMV